MLTPELVKQAIDTSHDACEKDCIHYAAIMGAEKEVMALLLSALFNPVTHANAPLSLFALGLHVGYRLRELESEQQTAPVNQANVN